MAIAAGTQLGPYEVLSQLGAGGMGKVYRARDTRPGREVAVKVLIPKPIRKRSGVYGAYRCLDQKPLPFLQTESDETGAQLSPDGRWMAYVSDESGATLITMVLNWAAELKQ